MAEDTGLDLVTGAFSYTGLAITRRLLARGRRVRTLTGHPDRPNPHPDPVETLPYAFDDPEALADACADVTTLYNTYWIRFERGGTTFDRAVENSRRLFEAAAGAGVRRVVHVSITNPDEHSPYPYFRGKARVERALREVGVGSGIVRPTVVFGEGDVLVNNLAWLLRRFPVFAIPGRGDYRVRPVHVDDVARLCVDAAGTDEDVVVEAVGPETFTFRDWVRVIRDAVGSRAPLVPVPALATLPLVGLIGAGVRDVLLTADELAGLRDELVTTTGRPTGRIEFTAWLRAKAPVLGRRYASEVVRHFRATRAGGRSGEG